ncbi:MAG: hypothetical protein AAFZ15_27830 [Bacteroidota bacterium]
MQKSLHISILLLFLIPVALSGSCYSPNYTITELLNYDRDDHHIFSCKILKTFIRGYDYESIAVVKDRYRGNPQDTIYINSGGSSTAGGEKLIPDSEWLIFSTTDDGLHYSATVCDYLSSQISDGYNTHCNRENYSLAAVYIDILEQYKFFEKEKYTGRKKILGKGKLMAEGHFVNGLPDSKWTHYRRGFAKGIKKSKINYKQGKLHGEYLIYHNGSDHNIMIEKRVYHNNLPTTIENYGGYIKKFEYLSDTKRKITSVFLDSTGTELKQVNQIELDYNNENYRAISFRDGYYFNKHARDSSQTTPLAEGYYSKGARIGEWKFFDKNGKTIRIELYPQKIEETSVIHQYEEDGQVRLEGIYSENRRQGVWKYYYQGQLVQQKTYDTSGALTSKINYYASGGMEYVPYLNNRKHGQQIVFDQNGSILKIEQFVKGKKEGKSISFNKNGSITEELNYINGRAFSISKINNGGFLKNGYLNGYTTTYNHRTNKKSMEGEYWNGYRTGVWTAYHENGQYVKQYYPTDRDELLNRCSNDLWNRWELYDKDGKLIQVFE